MRFLCDTTEQPVIFWYVQKKPQKKFSAKRIYLKESRENHIGSGKIPGKVHAKGISSSIEFTFCQRIQIKLLQIAKKSTRSLNVTICFYVLSENRHTRTKNFYTE